MLSLMSFTRSAPVGMDLMPLKRALDANDMDALNTYLAGLPQRSKNELLRLAGEEFGFQTYEVDGVRYMLATELSVGVYRHTNTAALRALLARYRHLLPTLRSVQHDVALFLKKAFKLPPKSIWTTLATWDHFAIAATKSETKMSERVQAYFLNSGVRVVADAIAEQETGHSVRPLVSLRRVGHHVQLLFKAAFKLPSKAAWTLFASWDHFAIACLKSETLMATESQAYLLDAGVVAADNVIAEEETGYSVV
jgi:hypothetical protein